MLRPVKFSRGGERSAWLFIGKLHSSTTEEELADYLEEKGISGSKTIEDLQSKGPNRLAVPLESSQRTGVLAKGSSRKALAISHREKIRRGSNQTTLIRIYNRENIAYIGGAYAY